MSENNDTDFWDKSQQVRQLAALPPDQLASHLTNTHQEVADVAPNLVPHLHSSAINAITFLNSKLPPEGEQLIQDGPPQVSRMEQAHWLKLHEVVNDPLKILEHANNGTLNQEHVQAVQAVYPALHQEIVGKMNEQLGRLKSKGKELPYRKRLQVSLLVGQPLDSTMTQPALQAAMQSNRPATPPNPRPVSKATVSQTNKVDAMYATTLQKRELNKK